MSKQTEETEMSSLTEEIQILKKEKQAMILAHYYVPDEVQEIADVTGDSFYLSKVAKEADAKILVFAGVSFMGESAKILNPEKKVLLPDPAADCAMAHMAGGKESPGKRGLACAYGGCREDPGNA